MQFFILFSNNFNKFFAQNIAFERVVLAAVAETFQRFLHRLRRGKKCMETPSKSMIIINLLHQQAHASVSVYFQIETIYAKPVFPPQTSFSKWLIFPNPILNLVCISIHRIVSGISKLYKIQEHLISLCAEELYSFLCLVKTILVMILLR